MLLEALIAILIFSLGILSLVALQGTSIQLTSDAKYRTDASLLANKLIGQMWASGGTAKDLHDNFDSRVNGKDYKAWLDHDVQASNSLPGIVATGDQPTLPTVSVEEVLDKDGKPPSGATAARVEIRIYWRTPQMSADQRHQHVVTSQIVFPNP